MAEVLRFLRRRSKGPTQGVDGPTGRLRGLEDPVDRFRSVLYHLAGCRRVRQSFKRPWRHFLPSTALGGTAPGHPVPHPRWALQSPTGYRETPHALVEGWGALPPAAASPKIGRLRGEGNVPIPCPLQLGWRTALCPRVHPKPPSPEGGRSHLPSGGVGLRQRRLRAVPPRHVPPVLGRREGYVRVPPSPVSLMAHVVVQEVCEVEKGEGGWAPAPTFRPSPGSPFGAGLVLSRAAAEVQLRSGRQTPPGLQVRSLVEFGQVGLLGVVHFSQSSDFSGWVSKEPASRRVPNSHSRSDAFMPRAHEDLQTLKARREDGMLPTNESADASDASVEVHLFRASETMGAVCPQSLHW
eukprot:127954-Amphidinium_carterae.3